MLSVACGILSVLHVACEWSCMFHVAVACCMFCTRRPVCCTFHGAVACCHVVQVASCRLHAVCCIVFVLHALRVACCMLQDACCPLHISRCGCVVHVFHGACNMSGACCMLRWIMSISALRCWFVCGLLRGLFSGLHISSCCSIHVGWLHAWTSRALRPAVAHAAWPGAA